MPTYSVRLIVNVPSIGDRTVDQTGITAPDMTTAIRLAMANIVMRATLVTETAP
jgi:hypothetical protein